MAALLPKATRSPASALVSFLAAMAVIAALYFGKDLFIPFALAILFSFLLSTPVLWLERVKMGRAPAVLVVMTLGLCLAGALSWLAVQQLSGIVHSLPGYRANLVHKLEALRGGSGTGVLGMAEELDNITSEVTSKQLRAGSTKNPNEPEGSKQKITPVPVEIIKPQPGPLAPLGGVGAIAVHYLAVALGVFVLTLFLLLNREHLRNRIFRLFGQGHLVLMTTALDEAAHRVSRYLLSQSIVNGSFGLVFGIGLFFLGVPYAPFWGGMVAVLRFIPYIGTFIAGACPFALSLAVFSDWLHPLITFAMYAVLEGSISSFLEPWLYSTRTGISSLAFLMSAAFWTLLWGPIGLVLSTPLTVCLAVLGRHLPPLEFLYVLLGDEPVLEPYVRYYQRLVAMDEDDAAELLETALATKPVVEVYDSIIIPALSLAEKDRHEGNLPVDREQYLFQATRELVDDINERKLNGTAVHGDAGARIACMGARDDADAIVAVMLAQLLRNAEIPVDVLDQADPKGYDVLVVSALPPFAVMHARSLCRRLKRAHPKLQIVLGVWNSDIPGEALQSRLGTDCADVVRVHLKDALEGLQQEMIAPDRLPAPAATAGV